MSLPQSPCEVPTCRRPITYPPNLLWLYLDTELEPADFPTPRESGALTHFLWVEQPKRALSTYIGTGNSLQGGKLAIRLKSLGNCSIWATTLSREDSEWYPGRCLGVPLSCIALSGGADEGRTSRGGLIKDAVHLTELLASVRAFLCSCSVSSQVAGACLSITTASGSGASL